MNIQLSLKEKWFRLTEKSKPEDYREITPFWCNRLLLFEGKKKPVKWWAHMENVEGVFFRKAIEDNIRNGKITFKSFEKNVMTLGYPKKTEKNKYLFFKHKGIEIRSGNPDWGAIPQKLYFVIMHGAVQQEA